MNLIQPVRRNHIHWCVFWGVSITANLVTSNVLHVWSVSTLTSTTAVPRPSLWVKLASSLSLELAIFWTNTTETTCFRDTDNLKYVESVWPLLALWEDGCSRWISIGHRFPQMMSPKLENSKTLKLVCQQGRKADVMEPCVRHYRSVPYRTIPYRTIPYRTIPYRTVLYRTGLYRTILYLTVLYHYPHVHYLVRSVMWTHRL